jgi:hypothetical protein
MPSANNRVAAGVDLGGTKIQTVVLRDGEVAECWRHAFARFPVPRSTAPEQDLDQYLLDYNYDRAHTGRLTHGRVPADIVYGARKPAPPDDTDLSVHLRVRTA